MPLVHVTQELGLDPRESPRPGGGGLVVRDLLAGALIPLLPYLLGFASLVAGLAVAGWDC